MKFAPMERMRSKLQHVVFSMCSKAHSRPFHAMFLPVYVAMFWGFIPWPQTNSSCSTDAPTLSTVGIIFDTPSIIFRAFSCSSILAKQTLPPAPSASLPPSLPQLGTPRQLSTFVVVCETAFHPFSSIFILFHPRHRTTLAPACPFPPSASPLSCNVEPARRTRW